MKKRIIALALALVMAAGLVPSAAVFTDISDDSEQWAAETLASLGIVSSVDRFNPDASLTRAEFCKMAVLAAGFSEESLYASYTIFPDVLASSWYSAYVNAAVRKYQILQGYPSGLFMPDNSITYGEAATILVKMLGYTVEDVGYFWPRDYVLKAEQVGLTREMDSLSADAPLPRGQAAILIRNLLLCDQKEGGAFSSQGFRVGEECLLAATWQSDSSLEYGEVRLFVGGEESIATAAQPLSSAMLGLMGTPVYAKTGNKIMGFIVSTDGLSRTVVTKAQSDAIETADGKITIPRSAKLLSGNTLSDYVTSYYDLLSGTEVTIYRDDGGQITLVSAGQTTRSLTTSQVYGVDDVVFTQNASIIKNGSAITREALSKYDVVSYSADDRTYYVSDDRVTLQYTDAKPTYTNPSTITAGGHTFAISESAAKYFKDLAFNRTITLLFDYNGEVAAAFDSSEMPAVKAPAILTELSGSEATVKLLSGLELKGAPSFSGFSNINYGETPASSLYQHVGRLVGVSQDAQGRLTFSRFTFSTGKAGVVNPVAQTVGKLAFSPQIRIFEEPASGMPLREIEVEDLGVDTLPSSTVKHVETDAAGKVSLLVLSNVTGDGFTYGLVSCTQKEVEVGYGLDNKPIYRTQYTLKVRSAKTENGAVTETTQTRETYYNPNIKTGSSMVPAAVAEGVLNLQYTTVSPAFRLDETATVKRDAFDSQLGVRVGSLYIELADNVQIYAPSIDRFLTLSEARANFDSFTLYCDRDPDTGGTVRIIMAR